MTVKLILRKKYRIIAITHICHVLRTKRVKALQHYYIKIFENDYL